MLNVEEYEKKSYYELLGVEESASLSEIKEAYLEIARLYHPDSNFYGELLEYELDPRDNRIFQLVTTAYNTLSKQEKRSAYDQTRKKLKGETSWNEARSESAPSKPAQTQSAEPKKKEQSTKPDRIRVQTVILETPRPNVRNSSSTSQANNQTAPFWEQERFRENLGVANREKDDLGEAPQRRRIMWLGASVGIIAFLVAAALIFRH